jgi:beta-N-acetylhexosaminidase
VYPSLVAFEGSNVSVGRGTSDAFDRFGAPWMDAARVASELTSRRLPGVRFVVDSFTPRAPGDNKYANRRIPGIRIDVTDRDAVRSGRLGAAILWALHRVNGDSLKITPRTFDERFGSTAIREAIIGGEDPDRALEREQPAVDRFLAGAAPFRLYR